jgi:hypothetical protein
VREEAQLQRAFRQLTQAPLHAALDQALEALAAAGVRTVALKGPLLGERLYGSGAARLSSDIDLLVLPAELDRAAAALAAIGYRSGAQREARYYREHTHHVILRRAHSPDIELHFRLSTGFGVTLPAEPSFARARRYVTHSGRSSWILAPEDEFLYLAVHAAGHCFYNLCWLYDLKLLIQHHPELDWSLMAARAYFFGVATALSFACEMLRRRLALPLPEYPRLPRTQGIRGRLAAALLSASRAPSLPARLRTCAGLAFQMALCDHARSATRVLHGHRLLKRHLARMAGTRPSGEADDDHARCAAY